METRLRLPADPDFCLIETMRLDPGQGVARVSAHIARLTRGARWLGLTPPPCLQDQVEALRAAEPQRVRLTLDRHSHVEITQAPFQPLGEGTIWRIGLATEILDQTDPFRAIKSSERAIYDKARVALPAALDEVVFVNRAGRVADGTITTLFVDFGDGLLTPRLADGALPGVLRATLIADGCAREAALTVDDVARARAVFVGNSLRGLIRATWCV